MLHVGKLAQVRSAQHLPWAVAPLTAGNREFISACLQPQPCRLPPLPFLEDYSPQTTAFLYLQQGVDTLKKNSGQTLHLFSWKIPRLFSGFLNVTCFFFPSTADNIFSSMHSSLEPHKTFCLQSMSNCLGETPLMHVTKDWPC